MTISEKIVYERKRLGYSQEELAERLEVSRQSVSKWEMGISYPEADKIIAMSELFCVSCDYLLKDDITAEGAHGVPTCDDDNEDNTIATVSDSNTQEYVESIREIFKKIALGVVMFVLSPAALITLAGLIDYGANAAVMIITGLLTLFIFVGIGLYIVIPASIRLSEYSDIMGGNVKISENMRARLSSELPSLRKTYTRKISAGVIISVFSAVPLIVTGILTSVGAPEILVLISTSLIFPIVAPAVYMFVSYGSFYSMYNLLINPSKNKSTHTKEEKRIIEAVQTVYWCVITATYLGVSFLTNKWGITWVIWPVAAVLSGALDAIVSFIIKKDK